MATSKSYFEYVKEQFSAIDAVGFRAMMGEYVVYYKGKVVGGIYDDRVLVNDTASAREMMPEKVYEIPYDGAKPMLLLSEIEESEFVEQLFNGIYSDIK